MTKGRPGVLHGSLMDVLQDAHGQILEPSLSQQVWTILVSVQNILITTISNVPAMSCEQTEKPWKDSNSCLVWKGLSQPWNLAITIAFAVKLAKELRTRQVYDCLPIQSWNKDVVQVKDRLEADAAKKGEAHT